jgi:outer membrane protein OmpA-like peptidoglycan-associated protein
MDLQLNNNLRAIITGFADRTGNPEFNAWISQQRAEAVKEYLIKQGISSDRLMMNFLGDAESQFANPADRKVEVVYVVNTAAQN